MENAAVVLEETVWDVSWLYLSIETLWREDWIENSFLRSLSFEEAEAYAAKRDRQRMAMMPTVPSEAKAGLPPAEFFLKHFDALGGAAEPHDPTALLDSCRRCLSEGARLSLSLNG